MADIGGTNCRFAVFGMDSENRLNLVDEVWLQTTSFDSFENMLATLESRYHNFCISTYEKAVLAVPAPIIGDNIIKMINIDWPINIELLEKKYTYSSICFINDFIAQAFGCLTTAADSAKIIKEGKASTSIDIAIVGAGTGLGHGVIKFNKGHGYLPLPAEAGQIAFPFTREEEFEYSKFIMELTGCVYPTSDLVVSGTGLSMLHRFLTGEDLPANEIAGKLSLNVKTTRWFSRFYARSCRNYCLNILASGGKLFISGGLAAKNEFLVNNDVFREEFTNCPLKTKLLEQISIYLNLDEKIGLWGAALYGMRYCQQLESINQIF